MWSTNWQSQLQLWSDRGLAAETWHSWPPKPKEGAERRSQWCLCCCAEEKQVPADCEWESPFSCPSDPWQMQKEKRTPEKFCFPCIQCDDRGAHGPRCRCWHRCAVRGDNTRVSPHVGTILPCVWDGSAAALTLKGITLPAQTHDPDGKPAHPESQRDLLSCFFHLYSTQYS